VPLSATSAAIVKSWILPSGNNFLKDPNKRAKGPKGNLGDGVAYVAPDFDGDRLNTRCFIRNSRTSLLSAPRRRPH
jgi:hypothetical protein